VINDADSVPDAGWRRCQAVSDHGGQDMHPLPARVISDQWRQ
jgi:hypothetical protein